jgi:hypothetical protein
VTTKASGSRFFAPSPRQANRNDRFRVLFQQEEVDSASVLVPMDWIKGRARVAGPLGDQF